MKNVFYSILLLLVFNACGKDTPTLPENRPADLVIDYHLDGGMNDYSVDINVFGDSCHYRKRREGKVSEKRFKLSAKELDDLYSVLKKNDFDKITYKTEDGTVYDRGGISIDVAWEGKQVRVSDAQSSFVAEKWYSNWKMVCEDIDAFAMRRGGF
jgi:hypothetical protein